MEVHKLELLIVDIDGYGKNDLVHQISNIDGFNIKIMNHEHVKTDEEWYDNNPLNFTNISKEDVLKMYNFYFKNGDNQ